MAAIEAKGGPPAAVAPPADAALKQRIETFAGYHLHSGGERWEQGAGLARQPSRRVLLHAPPYSQHLGR